jgi:hypothetical protein
MTESPQNQPADVVRKVSPHSVAKWFSAAVLASIVALSAYRSYLANSRYYMIQSGKNQIYEIDRQTGQTWIISGSKKIEVKDPTKAELMPLSLISQVDGRFGPRLYEGIGGFTGDFAGDLYNGTNWSITEVQIHLTPEFKVGETWSRTFHTEVSIKPFASGYVNFHISDRREFEKFSWTITEVRGFPPD